MLKRILAGVIGAMNVANGAVMFLDGAGWYGRVPGVTATGPYNPHFVQDIGIAFMVAGGALIACAWRPALWPAGLTGAAYVAGHALLHLAGIGETHHAAFEIALLVVPSFLAVWAALPEKHHA